MKCKDMNAFSTGVFLIVSLVLNTSAVIVSSKSVVTLQPVSPNNFETLSTCIFKFRTSLTKPAVLEPLKVRRSSSTTVRRTSASSA